MTIKTVIFLIISCFIAFNVVAQQTDNVLLKADTLNKPAAKVQAPVKDSTRLALERLPRRAAIASAILPGLGQYYNKGLWWIKVPAIYGGFVSLGLVYNFNQQQYKVFLKEAQFRAVNPRQTQNPLYASYPDNSIIQAKDIARRNRDLTILATLGFHTLNIIDAYVTAKFFRFDISDDLGLKVYPSLQPQPFINAYSSPVPVLKLHIPL